MTTVWTIGHSTHALDELIALLNANRIRQLFDVRRYPASRRHPQFNRTALEHSLPIAAIEYRWLPELGGRRVPRKDSHNTAWRNSGFRGYADYMETEVFQLAIADLLRQANETSAAIMCAEQAWQQCHRGLIADFLKARGNGVDSHPRPRTHAAASVDEAAQLLDGELSYAGDEKPEQRDLEL